MFARVFVSGRPIGLEASPAGLGDDAVPQELLLAAAEQCGIRGAVHFRGDDEGWFEARLMLDSRTDAALVVERYLAGEEGIRRELNAWAAWLEDALGEERAGAWMARIIATTDLLTIRLEGEQRSAEGLLPTFARALALRINGLVQIDGEGLFDFAGVKLASDAASDP